jgi:tetraacyldisaccharide 4'-kinase
MKKLLQAIYLGLTTCERKFFELFNFLIYRPQARVISIGNLSMGGTGKTPVLLELIEELSRDHRVCVLSRGYRSPWERSFYHLQGSGPHPSGLTDEAVLVNRRFSQIPILLGKNRHHAAIMGERRCQPDIFLLDDGFQYRRLYKDCDLLLWDAMSEPQEASLLPAGRLREPVSRLRDASAILLTRCESVSEDKKAFWENWLSEKAPGIPIIQIETRCDGLFDYRNRQLTADEVQSSFLAFSAIGRPESFYAQLEQLGCQIEHRVEFRDHHHFTDDELRELQRKATDRNLRLVCSEKDVCKISAPLSEELNLSVLKIRTLPASGRSFKTELAAVGIRL